MKLKLYALRDSKNGYYYSPATGYDDKNIIQYYNNISISVLKEHIATGKNLFLKDKILDSQIYKLGEIDLETGELTNDNNFLSNLVSLEDLALLEESDKNEI